MADRTKSHLASELASLTVPKGCVALAWLGQAGFVLKSPTGCRIALDPYLSNSCKAVGQQVGVNMDRKVRPPLKPSDLVPFDGIVVTHSHQDHIDPETVRPYLRAGGEGLFIAPHEASDRLVSIGVAAERIRVTWPNNVHRVGDFEVRATFAIPPAGDDLTHVGYLISVKGGPKIYFTGDTDYSEVLGVSVAPHRPDIMVTVINPAFGNLSPREAARLAKTINPKWVIPSHHDLFPDNSLPDRLLRTNLILEGMGEAFLPLKHGTVYLFGRGGRANSGKAQNYLSLSHGSKGHQG